MASDGRIEVLLNSNVKEIQTESVTIANGDATKEIKNDSVIISAGGILPTAFLQKIGINVETKWGTE
jgi:thioredoxin reductase